jgi:hypothetical protein
MERELEAAVAVQAEKWVAFVAGEIRRWPTLPGFAVHRVPTASWVRPKFIERLFAVGVRGVLIVRDARAEAWARDGGRWVEARLAGERTPVLRTERMAGGKWCVIDFDPSKPAALVRAAQEFRQGAARRPPPSHRVALVTCLALAGAITALAVAPSDLRVTSTASAAPELVLSIKAFGVRVQSDAPDAVADAAKPVHMRGRVTGKPHRADVVVRLTIDGVMEERAFPAKGFSHDGPAIGEWRREWPAGEHQVVIEIVPGGVEPIARWEGALRSVERRLSVVMYDPNLGFIVD